MKKNIFIIMIPFIMISCITFKFTIINSWSEENVTNSSGCVTVINSNEFDIAFTNFFVPYVKATLKSGNITKDVFLAIDTGSEGNLIDYEIIDFFSDLEKSEFIFSGSLAYTNENRGSKDSFYFDSLNFGSVYVDKILFQVGPIKKSGNITIDGYPVDGIIGMDILKKYPFVFYPSKKKMAFLDNKNVLDNSIIFNLDKNRTNEILLPIKIKSGTILSALDTGSPFSLLRSVDFDKEKKDNSVFNYKFKQWIVENEVMCLKNISFLDKTFFNVPVYKTQNFCENGTIGSDILFNFNFYVDMKNGFVKFQFCKNDFFPDNINDLNWPVIGSLNKNVFGFTLNEVNGVRHVDCVFIYSNGKAMLPEVKYGDELISIDGIPQFVYPWTKWNNLQEADFVFKRGKKEFTVHAKRKSLYLENEE